MPVEVEQYVRFDAVVTFDFLCFCSQFLAAPRKLSKADMKNKNNRRILTWTIELCECVFVCRLQFLVFETQSRRSFAQQRYAFECRQAYLLQFPRTNGPHVRFRLSYFALRMRFVSFVCRILAAKHTRVLQKNTLNFFFSFRWLPMDYLIRKSTCMRRMTTTTNDDVVCGSATGCSIIAHIFSLSVSSIAHSVGSSQRKRYPLHIVHTDWPKTKQKKNSM